MQLESALLRFARQLLHPTNAEGGASTSAQTVPDMQVTVRSGANLVPFRDLTVCLSIADEADNRQTHSPPSSDFLVSLSMPVNSRHGLQNYIFNVEVVDQSRMSKFPRH
jgi:hypothetical protein